MNWQYMSIGLITLNAILLAGWGYTLAKSMSRGMRMYELGREHYSADMKALKGLKTKTPLGSSNGARAGRKVWDLKISSIARRHHTYVELAFACRHFLQHHKRVMQSVGRG